jgi:hypothetical protein
MIKELKNQYEDDSDLEEDSIDIEEEFDDEEKFEEDNQDDEEELEVAEEDLEDEEQEGPYYECPFCNRRVYDPFGCPHAIYIWDAVNFEVSYLDDNLEKLIINIVKCNPKKWINDYEDYDEDNLEYQFYKIADPETIINIIYGSEIAKILKSFSIEEAADTDHRSYYIGKFFGIADKDDIKSLEMCIAGGPLMSNNGD